MRNLVLVAGLVAVGCGRGETGRLTEEQVKADEEEVRAVLMKGGDGLPAKPPRIEKIEVSYGSKTLDHKFGSKVLPYDVDAFAKVDTSDVRLFFARVKATGKWEYFNVQELDKR